MSAIGIVRLLGVILALIFGIVLAFAIDVGDLDPFETIGFVAIGLAVALIPDIPVGRRPRA